MQRVEGDPDPLGLAPAAVRVRRRILTYLHSDDPRLVKNAVQTLCSLLERNPTLSLSDDVRVGLARHGRTQDIYVRRWLSKLFGLLGDVDYVPWVRDELLLRETDPENRTWAVAALGALNPHADPAVLLRGYDLPWSASPFGLAVRYFRPERAALDVRAAMRSSDDDDPLSPMWLALLHSQGRGTVPDGLIGALTGHDNPRVAEYAIWALVQHPHAGLSESTIDPRDIPAMPSQMRRWSLRLLGKDPVTLHSYGDLVLETISRDDDPVVREGLALAIKPWRLAAPLAARVAAWYLVEDDALVQDALGEHLEAQASQVSVYREALESRPVREPAVDLLPDYASPVAVLIERPRRILRMAKPPSIRSEEAAETYLVGMDTVGFSKLPDTDQVAILQQLLAACASDREASSVSADDAVYLITGDGLIVGFRGSGAALLPLQMALRLNAQNKRIAGYRLRFGVHAGPARWLLLEDAAEQRTRQLLGTAVNWTARVMNAAGDGEVLVSQAYHDAQAYPARDYLPGVAFTALEEAQTKHGESLRLLRAELVN